MLITKDSNEGEWPTWITSNGYDELKEGNLYLVAMYYTVTTITTVGYGDISAYNPAERCLAILVMIVGVIAFSYATGSLSSLITD